MSYDVLSMQCLASLVFSLISSFSCIVLLKVVMVLLHLLFCFQVLLLYLISFCVLVLALPSWSEFIHFVLWFLFGCAIFWVYRHFLPFLHVTVYATVLFFCVLLAFTLAPSISLAQCQASVCAGTAHSWRGGDVVSRHD